MSHLIGQTLGPYRIVEQIGIGGMATVYKAYQPSMDRYVAIKVLPAPLSHDPDFLKRFRREAQVVAKLEHTHILPVYDYGEQEGLTYLVMRYGEMGTLKDRLAAGQLDLLKIYRIVAQVGAALDYAHRLGVIHRDVKPSNVLIDSQGDAYLTDFGLARMMGASEQLTASGVGIGTPAYMSPEQGKGIKIDHRSDIYSLGVMLYEMVTGQVPYQAETPVAVVIKHITEPLPLPRQIVSDLPEGVERVILKAMAKDPDDRFQTVREMVEALNLAVRAATAAAPAAAWVEREGLVPVSAAPAKLRWPWDGRTTALGVGLAALALLVIGGLFFALSHIQYRVQVVGGRVEVVPVSTEAVTPTPAVALVETPTRTPIVRWTATPTIAIERTATSVSGAARATTPTLARPTATAIPATPSIEAVPPVVGTLSWERLADGANFPPVVLNALAVDPNNPNTVFAGTYGAGLYVSRDGGQTWTPSNAGLGKGTVGRIVIDPRNSNIVYTALFEQGGVYKSADGGRTWSAANQGLNLDGAGHTGQIYLDPTDSRHLYYSATTDGLYSSGDGGATWQQRSSGCPWITGLVINSTNGDHLYASNLEHGDPSCVDGVYESHDGGRTWGQLTTAEMVQVQGEWWYIAADPRDFDTIYAAGNYESPTFKSTDGGQTWTQVLEQGCVGLAINPADGTAYCGRGLMQMSRDGGASWSSPDFGPGWGGLGRFPFAIAPSDPMVVYAGDNAVMRSTDGGETWTGIGWLGAAARMGLTVNPHDSNRLFLANKGMYVHGAFRSRDGGKSWQNAFSHVTGDGRLTMHPTQDIVYYASHWEGRLYRSSDDGQTWELFGSGDITGPWQVVPDAHDPARLWLASDAGPAISKNGGETFARVESFPATGDQPILLVNEDGRRMYVVNADGGLYRSDDAGETWRTLGTMGGSYYAAALDPSNPDVVYIGSTHKGVLKTENGGMGWRQVNTGLTDRSINELAIDPANPQTVYAATDGGAFVSTDGGAQWSHIQDGLGPNPIVYSIAIDSNDSSKVYAVTPDGVFRLVGAPPEAAALTSMP